MKRVTDAGKRFTDAGKDIWEKLQSIKNWIERNLPAEFKKRATEIRVLFKTKNPTKEQQNALELAVIGFVADAVVTNDPERKALDPSTRASIRKSVRDILKQPSATFEETVKAGLAAAGTKVEISDDDLDEDSGTDYEDAESMVKRAPPPPVPSKQMDARKLPPRPSQQSIEAAKQRKSVAPAPAVSRPKMDFLQEIKQKGGDKTALKRVSKRVSRIVKKDKHESQSLKGMLDRKFAGVRQDSGSDRGSVGSGWSSSSNKSKGGKKGIKT